MPKYVASSPKLRVLVLSDLHQGDGGPSYDPAILRRFFDVAIVAGDCAGKLTNSLEWIGARFSGVPAIYVPGNHDFYRHGSGPGFTIEDELERGRETANRVGVTLLTDGQVAIEGVRILGGTLWTDFRSSLHRDLNHALADARRGMNDYRRIHRRSSTRRSRRLRPADTRRFHMLSRAFLGRELSSDEDRRTIVVTHHAPSLRSLTDPYDTLNICYASDLEPEIRLWKPPLWIHGHIHRKRDYEVGQTRILCNPLGRTDETTGFDPELVVEI